MQAEIGPKTLRLADLGGYLTEHSSDGICLIFFLMVAWGHGFLKGDQRSKYHPPHIISRADGVNVTTAVMLTLVTGLMPCKVTMTPFHVVIFGRQPLSLPTPQEQQSGLPSWKWRLYICYLEFFSMRDLTLLSLYIQVFISAGTRVIYTLYAFLKSFKNVHVLNLYI